jgi:queuine tRNA-ribosyltransferase
MLPFTLTHEDPETAARAAELATPHGTVRTPAFMPVGTAGTVKGVAGWELERLAPEMVLANTYHLLLRPGVDTVERMGGLHRLMAWSGPILTDSGGYQVFSLAARRRLDDDGVTFHSHLDGSRHRLTPESVVETQSRYGVDVAMVLDECLPYPVELGVAEESVARSVGWALRGLDRARRLREAPGSWQGGLFAIQQGSLDEDLRRRCTTELAGHEFDGFAIGGLAVGEPPEALHDGVAMAAPMLPRRRPRYLMGVGYPEDLLHAVACGVDLFDCVLPTRSARTGKVFTASGELNIKNARFADDPEPLDDSCDCPTCARYSRAALRHLYVANEVTSVVLLTVHNLSFFLSLMRGAREAIMAGRYGRFRQRFDGIRNHRPRNQGPATTAR